MLKLGQYSIGMGDRFGHQAAAQLRVAELAHEAGLELTPVWNKSHREHTLVGSVPMDQRRQAEKAVAAAHWTKPYFVDADHIGLKNVDLFLEACDFYTLDVADFIAGPIDEDKVRHFVACHQNLTGSLPIPGLSERFELSAERLTAIARQYLPGVAEAGRIYRHIVQAKASNRFVTEVSMDETDTPQTPEELLVILAALADERIPVQTIAPKFSGQFNKGVDYVGDPEQFTREFERDVCVIAFAVREFGLPAELKLSIHSGSDKFTIYEAMQQTLAKHGAGLHLKTAGTNWLEELIGLAESGGEGLAIVKQIYAQALTRCEELSEPYSTVIDIDPACLPTVAEVADLSGDQFAAALRHDLSCPTYNCHLRQLLHIAFKLAAEMGERYTAALEANANLIGRNVTANLFERHVCPVFLGNVDWITAAEVGLHQS